MSIRWMRPWCLVFPLVAFLAACNKEPIPVEDEKPVIEEPAAPSDVPSQPEMRTIQIGASSSDSETKTTLVGNRVIWDEGDQFRLIKDGPLGTSDVLRVVVDRPSAGLAFEVTGANTLTSDVNFKYNGLKVEIDGLDVTSSIFTTDQNSDNKYLFGATNSKNKYQYAPVGTDYKLSAKGSGSTRNFLAVRSSSSSDYSSAKKAVVTFSGLQWKWNIGSWNNINESNAVIRVGKNINGMGSTTLDDVASYEWLHGISSLMTLDDQPGRSFGAFSGSIPANTEIDETTRAVFPASYFSSFELGTITMNIPGTQDYVENSFDHKANVMVGNVETLPDGTYDAKFRNLMGTMVLSLKGDNDAIASIVLKDRAGRPLWGTAKIPADGYESGISTSMITGGSASLTLSCPGVVLDQTAKDFYFVVPVGAFAQGLEVVINKTDGGTMTFGTTADNTIAVSSLRRMPVVYPATDCNVENNAVIEYLDKGPYSSWGANTYFLSNQTLKTLSDFGNRSLDQDNPRYYHLSWAGSPDAQYYVTFTDQTKGRVIYADREVTGTQHDLINMVPGHTYSYSVADGTGTTCAEGRFKATGRVRMVTVSDSWNWRDMGGWQGLGGRKVAYEWLYRGGSLNGVWKLGTTTYAPSVNADPDNYEFFSEESRNQLIDMGIKAELDLRSIPSEEKSSSNENSHAFSLQVPHTGIDADQWEYMRIMNDNAQATPLTYYAFVQDLAWIIDQVVYHNRPVAFHCKSGADRTGMLAFAIHALLGVEIGNLALDFEMTNMSHENKVVKGSTSIRGKYTYQNTGGMFGNGITTLGSNMGSNLQEKAYYYFNRYFENQGIAISSTDLDKFIEKMLGMREGTYQHPSFAQQNSNTLQSIYSTPQTNKIQ